MADFSQFFQYPNQIEPDQSQERYFASFTPETWAKIVPYTETLIYSKDDVVVNYKEKDRSLYILLEGSCSVYIPNDTNTDFDKVAVISQGSVIGELSFLDGRERSATVKADVACTALRFSLDSFKEFSANKPALAVDFLLELGKILAARFRQASLEWRRGAE